ncbi:MAG: ADP-ribosylation factor-like protein, partial [Promethearchaeota archaeon]
MTYIGQVISGVWIMDANSGLPLIERQYVSRAPEEEMLIGNFLSAILSFTQQTLADQKVDTILLKDQKIIYDISNSIVFVTISSRNFETYIVKKILSHIRANFFKNFPAAASENWQFDRNITGFKKFGPQIDLIIQQFSSNVLLLNLIVVGLDNAGKTTLAYSYAQKRKNMEYIPTKGLDITRFRYYFRNRDYSVCLWDLGGQEAYRDLWPRFASEASGLLYVVDSTADRWNEDKLTFKEITSIFDIPYVCIANKQDLLTTAQSSEYTASRLGISTEQVFPASALLEEGIQIPLEYLMQKIADREDSPAALTKIEITSPFLIQRVRDLGLYYLMKKSEKKDKALQETISKLKRLIGFDLAILQKLNRLNKTFEPVMIVGKEAKKIGVQAPKIA